MREDPFASLAHYLEPNNVLAFDGNFGIKLNVMVPKIYVVGRTTGYRTYIEAFEPRGLEREIFMYQRTPVLYKGSSHKDVFQGIASPADMEEYPIGDPSTGSPFFRLAIADLVFRDLDRLTKSIELIAKDTEELIRAMAGLDVLKSLGTIDVGNPESSSSSSSSA